MTSTTYAGILRPAVAKDAVLYDIATILGGTALLALCARVSFYIGPVPVTAQTFGVLIVGALLGSRRGALCVLAYLAEGASGLPVFVGGAGPAYMAGPTGGFLVGFVPAAFLVGFLAEKGWDRRIPTAAAMMTTGLAAIYGCGIAWLTVLFGFNKALALGLTIPFLVGEIAKVSLATALLPSGWKLLSVLSNKDA
ncbi:biotin transporter BioY [Candidatus Sumerlaeota bacterium]|nr:biotin transporter BioY [Candidatus Sumerlaeota bacterium]